LWFGGGDIKSGTIVPVKKVKYGHAGGVKLRFMGAKKITKAPAKIARPVFVWLREIGRHPVAATATAALINASGSEDSHRGPYQQA
jgi:hypothetical protein